MIPVMVNAAPPTGPSEPVAAAKEISQGFAGIVVNGQEYTDKDEAGRALLSAIQGVTSADVVEIGSYRGFTLTTEVRHFTRELVLKGEMTHRVEAGSDPRGNLLRLDHALDKMPERLESVKAQLANIMEQREAAKAEVGKPFPQEDELRWKSARLAELDAELNIDGGPRQEEQAIAKSARPSVLEGLKRPLPPKQNSDRPKNRQQERER